MHLKIETNKLASAVRTVTKGVSKGSQSTILEGILFDCKDGVLTLYSTDLRISVKTVIPCEVIDEGRCVINSGMINSVISKIQGEWTDFIVDCEMKVIIKCGRSRLTFQALSPFDFPDFPKISEDFSFEMKATTFKELVNKTRVSVSDDQNRLIYTGVKFIIDNNNVTAVSLDGYRISIVKRDIDASAKQEFIVPASSLYDVEKMVGDEDTISIKRYKSHAIFEFGYTTLYTKLFDGDFFDYTGLIRTSGKTELVVSKRELFNAMDRSTIVAKTNLNMVRLDITETNIHITSSGNLGETTDDVEALRTGEDLVIGFNPRYMKDGVQLFEDDKIKLIFGEGTDPVSIYGTAEEGFTYILLPVRIQN